jgi:hypothetical protein
MELPRVSKNVVDLLPSVRAVARAVRRVGSGLLLTAFAGGSVVTAQAALPPQDSTFSIKAAPLVMQQASAPSTMHAQHWSHSSHYSHSSHSSHASHYSHYSSR